MGKISGKISGRIRKSDCIFGAGIVYYKRSGAKWIKWSGGEGTFGKYKHTLDPKGRLFVPAKLREELGSAFYVARSLDPCLTVYTEEEWQRIVERSKAAPSSKARGLRTFFANVVRCEPDKQGRFLLPDDLRKYAGIQQEVYFLGQAGRAEIWAAERYEEEEANVSAEELAALMEEIGI